MFTLKITTPQMFINYMKMVTNVVADNGQDDLSSLDYVKPVSSTILCNNMEGIRKLFKDGYTSMLLSGRQFIAIDKKVEEKKEIQIRVYNEDNVLLGVVINSEINF